MSFLSLFCVISGMLLHRNGGRDVVVLRVGGRDVGGLVLVCFCGEVGAGAGG